jgi:hypothetical protein
VTDWSSFSPCSVSCGQGITERRRWYINDKSNQDPKCKDIYLIEKRQCQGADSANCHNNENKGLLVLINCLRKSIFEHFRTMYIRTS